MLNPAHINVNVKKRGFNKQSSNKYEAQIKQIDMRIDGDYVIQGEGKEEDLHLALNDDMYHQGRTVNKLSDNYDNISALCPVFARAGQLMGLYHAMAELRYAGFRLNNDLAQTVKNQFSIMEERHVPKEQQFCVALPYFSKYRL